ncbi:hypothetical protein TRVA0_012S01288 [Trichomonascus vanleenenianus]|uniref:eukaryotic translation initiation factor 4E n=1 Tax=Trichomonascus vanleenenianus TaxID=2268995 RepID=UPI003ECA0E3F
MSESNGAPSESIWNRRTTEKSSFLASTGVKMNKPGPAGHSGSRFNSHFSSNYHHHHQNHHGNHPGQHNNHHHQNRHRNNTHHNEPDEVNAEGLRVVKPRLGSSVLNASWTVWFLHRGPGLKISNYLLATKQVGTFSTVEEFWDIYSHLRRIDRLPFTSEFQVFQKNVKPMWEDPINVNGGKWVVRLKRPMKDRKRDDEEEEEGPASGMTHAQCRHQAVLHWENLLLAVLGGTLAPPDADVDHDEILGLVVSVRRDEDILSVWTKRHDNIAGNDKIKAAVKRVLTLPDDFKIDYKVHVESIKEGAKKQALYDQQHSPTAKRRPQKEDDHIAASAYSQIVPNQDETGFVPMRYQQQN